MTSLFQVGDAVIETTVTVAWGTLVFGLLGGLAIFLIGMDRMTDALKLIVGDRARRVLERLTSNRSVGMLTGAGITAVVQSSSVTTVLVVGFISVGLMTFAHSIPVIIGSNIGSTLTVQIIAFKVTNWALALVAAGFALSSLARRERSRAKGTAIMGLGLVFFGMVVMGDAMSPLRTYEPFVEAMRTLDNPLYGILIGAAITALIQSSAATAGMVIILASYGLISLEAGIGLVLGANIGTSMTALLAAIGKPRNAQRAAIAHLLFNVIGVIIWFPLIDILASQMSSLGGGTPREIANAHTFFNIVNALIFFPFVNHFAALVERVLPDKLQAGAMRPKHVDFGLLNTPGIALAKARMEMLRMASRVQGMLMDVLPAILDCDIDTMADVEKRDDEVDSLHGIILEYLGRISQQKLSEESSDELVDLIEATNSLEAIGDLVELNLVALGYQKIEESIEVSGETRSLIEDYHKLVVEAFELALVAVVQNDQASARRVSGMKREIKHLERKLAKHQVERLVVDEPNRVATYRFETDVEATLKRVYYFSRRIARAAVSEHEQSEM